MSGKSITAFLAVILIVGIASTANAYFAAAVILNTTGADDSYFTGPPDNNTWGIAGREVIYDFGSVRIVDGAGHDFNVYELDGSAGEIGDVDVLVSKNGTDWVEATSYAAGAVHIPGDEGKVYFWSFELYFTGLDWIRYVRIDGHGDNMPSDQWDGFDLDAVGAINTAVVPVPGAVWLLGSGLLGLAGLRKRKNRG